MDRYPEKGPSAVSNLVSSCAAKMTWRITMQNTGTGIAASDLEKTFKMFSQARSPTALAMGLGIDLVLMRTIVQMHGGTVRAFSEGPGLGKTFIVCLPLAAGALAAPELPVWREGSTAGSRVLVVDDNADAALSLATLLRMLGHEVRTAADGTLAVEQVQTFAPDVAFVDLAASRLDGFDTARCIRTSVHDNRLPIVALTGWRQQTDGWRMYEAGMEHRLIKPVSLDALQSLFGTLARGKTPSRREEMHAAYT